MRAIALALTLMTCLAAGTSLAAEPETPELRDRARQHGLAGIQAYNDGDWNKCVTSMAQAEQLLHAPAHLLYLARCKVKLDQVAEAYRIYVSIAVEPIPSYAAPAFHQAQAAARDELAALRPRISGIELVLHGATGLPKELVVDGELVEPSWLDYPLALEPGEHSLQVRAADHQPLHEQIRVDAGVSRVELTLQPMAELPAPAPNPAPANPAPLPPSSTEPLPAVGEGDNSSTLLISGATSLGVGGAAVAAGAVLGALTLSQANEIKSGCKDSVCPLSLQSDAEDAETLGTASTVLLIAGGAVAAVGLVLVLIPGDPEGSAEEAALAELGLRLTPSGLKMIGRF